MNQKKIFFPNLDGIRFFCFLSVFLFHTWSNLFKGGNRNGFGSSLFENGNLGVNFFFVLSGYLITYLLIAEKKIAGRINIPKFWMRRILRIWPLYFLCVLLGFLIIPLVLKIAGRPEFPTGSPLAYLTFTSNFDYIKNGYPGSTILEVLWSIAVEEQFYFFWPLLLAIVPRRYYLFLFSFIITGSFIFRLIYHDPQMHTIHTFSCIGDMAVGAIGAWASFSEKFTAFFQRLRKRDIIFIYLVALTFFFFRTQLFYHGVFLQAVDRLLIAVAFLLIILEQNYAAGSLFKFSRYKRISQLGIISYGLYCYHELAITAIFVGFGFLVSADNLFLSGIKIILSLAVTIAIAMISYWFFETPFLNLKKKYSLFVKGGSTTKKEIPEKKILL